MDVVAGNARGMNTTTSPHVIGRICCSHERISFEQLSYKNEYNKVAPTNNMA